MKITGGSSLSHIYWLGGSPCAGKSSIADRLASEFGMRIYRCDDAFYDHASVVTPDDQPTFHRLVDLDTDGVWLRPVQQQIDEEIALYREEFPLILKDLLALPDDTPVIAEGAALMPDLVASLGIERHRMLWMVPTEPFQRTHYERRDWRHDVLRDCSDPERGWENWMRRDAEFAMAITRQAESRGLTIITVDGSMSLDAHYDLAQDHFNLTAR